MSTVTSNAILQHERLISSNGEVIYLHIKRDIPRLTTSPAPLPLQLIQGLDCAGNPHQDRQFAAGNYFCGLVSSPCTTLWQLYLQMLQTSTMSFWERRQNVSGNGSGGQSRSEHFGGPQLPSLAVRSYQLHKSVCHGCFARHQITLVAAT